jgi:eukaryotic-like serine/threonine-protein kinase
VFLGSDRAIERRGRVSTASTSLCVNREGCHFGICREFAIPVDYCSDLEPRIRAWITLLLDLVYHPSMSTTDRQSVQDSLTPGDAGGDHAPRDLTGVTLDDFRVEKILGRGGMGEVYLATQVSLNRLVALKVLKPDFASNPTYLGRLKTEATAVAKLNHPNIVHVYTLGCVDDINFIAMEYVQGTNLRDYILKKGALELPLAYSIMKQTAQAIGAAGEIGLIHRDVKPENILLTRKGRVKVADFGLCRDQDGQALHLTQSGVTMGTPLYMSPEQAQGHAVDHRSDLYSLGVTFYHMLAGAPPFRAETALALALKQVRETPRSMLVHRPDLPSELDHLVLKLIAKSPAERYQSAGEMLADLTKLREVLHIDAAPTITDAGSTAGDESGPASRSAAASGTSGGVAAPSAMSVLERASSVGHSASESLSRLSAGLIAAVMSAGVVLGAIAGWTNRSPDVMAVPRDATTAVPVLWIDPGWSALPRKAGAEEQLHYALFEAEPADRVAAFLAVPGFFAHSHDQVSKAYTQLARIWFRDCNIEALEALEAELSVWKSAKTHEQELLSVVRIAVNLRKSDLDGVLEGFKGIMRDAGSDMYDPALVELCLEICTDALAAATRAGTESTSIMRETLQEVQSHLVWQLYRIEVPKANRVLPRAAAKRT